jgi:hypothetical protein
MSTDAASNNRKSGTSHSQGNLKVRVRKTPNGLHPYIATMKGRGIYGWGNTPTEARAKLTENLARRMPTSP